MNAPRLLIAEGNDKKRCEYTAGFGLVTSSERYRMALSAVCPEAEIDIVFAADPDGALPSGADLAVYDGVVIGGSSLNIPGGGEDPRVARQIEFAKAVFEAGVPFLGSCWGLQLAAVASGGNVASCREGRELGIARKIALTPEGRGALFFEGKASVFDSPAIHYDEVTHLPAGGVVLASNTHSAVQAATITHNGGVFWGLQYHPEFDLSHMAGLIRAYVNELVEDGFFENSEAAGEHAMQMEVLHQDPTREDLAWLLGVDEDVLDERIRYREFANWIERLVKPRMADRA